MCLGMVAYGAHVYFCWVHVMRTVLKVSFLLLLAACEPDDVANAMISLTESEFKNVQDKKRTFVVAPRLPIAMRGDDIKNVMMPSNRS